jgi:hypothetical protein
LIPSLRAYKVSCNATCERDIILVLGFVKLILGFIAGVDLKKGC